jgi:hypothetical protein
VVTSSFHFAIGQKFPPPRRGYSALIVNTYRMPQLINGGRAHGTSTKRLQVYVKRDLLVRDDLELKELRRPAPQDFMTLST